MRPFGKKQELEDLGARLRSERPEPSAELFASVEASVSAGNVERRPQSRLRYGLAAGFAASVAIVFAAFGGFGTFSTPTASSRVTLAVPASAVPALKALQAKGGILAASPTRYTKAEIRAGKVKGIVLAPSSPDIETAISKAEAKNSGLKLAPVDKAVRTNLVPSSLGSSAPVVRYAATVVYVPGVFIPICAPAGGGIYYSILWPASSPLPPGATIGFCPGYVFPPV